MEEEKTLQEALLEDLECKIKDIAGTEGVNIENVDYLYKLVDIHKDLKNENYWKVKEEHYNEIQRLWGRLWRVWRKNERCKRSLYGRVWQTWRSSEQVEVVTEATAITLTAKKC